jgi:hypothetical protein
MRRADAHAALTAGGRGWATSAWRARRTAQALERAAERPRLYVVRLARQVAVSAPQTGAPPRCVRAAASGLRAARESGRRRPPAGRDARRRPRDALLHSKRTRGRGLRVTRAPARAVARRGRRRTVRSVRVLRAFGALRVAALRQRTYPTAHYPERRLPRPWRGPDAMPRCCATQRRCHWCRRRFVRTRRGVAYGSAPIGAAARS